MAVAAAALAIPTVILWARHDELTRTWVTWEGPGLDPAWKPAFAALLVFLVMDLLAKLYLTWIGGKLTEAEAAPGAKGFRAWLSILNLLCVLGISFCCYATLDWSFIATLISGVLLLLAYPTFNSLSIADKPASDESEISDERRRVLALVESGKITGEDGAELIGALGQSHAISRQPSNPVSVARRVMLLGAALVLTGFFLPWFEINVGSEVKRVFENFGQQMGPQNFPQGIPNPVVTGTITVHGGDIAHGLGWIILILALGAAVLSILWPARRDNLTAQKGITLAVLAMGSVIAIYLISDALKYTSAGMALVVAGYALLWIGAIREYMFAGRMTHPRPATTG